MIMSRRDARLKPRFLLCLAAWPAIGGLSACGNSSRVAGSPTYVATTPATTFSGNLVVSAAEPAPSDFVGVVFSRAATEITAQVDGILRTLLVWPGDRVTRGMPLATLEARTTEQEVHEAASSVQMAEADSKKAEVELEQAKEQLRRSLALGSLISSAELENARTQVVLAQTQFDRVASHGQALSARLRLSKRSLQDTVLRAPFDGVIAIRYAEVGTLVLAGHRVLRIVGSEELWIRFAVPEERIFEVKTGQTVKGEFPAIGYLFDAVVANIAPEVDEATHAVFVEARLGIPPTHRGRLVVGLEARVHLTSENQTPWLPSSQAASAPLERGR